MTVESLIISIGYPAVFLLIMGESAGIPMPGETAVLIAAGAAGAGKAFNIWLVFLFSASGAIVGDTLGYWIGRRGGRPLLEKVTGKLWLKKEHIEKTEKFFIRHGGKAVFFGRSVSYLRVLSALMAGVSHMPYGKFLFWNAFGGIVWAAIVCFIGFKFGQNLEAVKMVIHEIGIGAGISIVALVALYFLAAKLQWISAIRAFFTKGK